VVAEELRKAGGVPRRERQLLVRKAVIDAHALAAIESTGRYYFQENAHCPSAMIALVQVLNVLTESGSRLDELIAPLNRYARSGPRTYTADAPDKVVSRLAEQFGNASIDYLDGITVQYDDWWFNLRPSDDPHVFCLNLEAHDEAALKVRLAEVGRVIGEPTDT
jgi:phosphomannomutase